MIPYAMLCVSVNSPILSNIIRCLLSLHSSVQTGIPVLYSTVRYCNVLILTDGLRIGCGNTSKFVRKASSAPALFILVTKSKVQTGTDHLPGDRFATLHWASLRQPRPVVCLIRQQMTPLVVVTTQTQNRLPLDELARLV